MTGRLSVASNLMLHHSVMPSPKTVNLHMAPQSRIVNASIPTDLLDLTIKYPFSHADILIKDNLSPAGSEKKPHLSDEDLLLTPTMVYGFSLSDKLWRELRFIFENLEMLTVLDLVEFNINLVTEVEWNDNAFKNLVLPAEKKSLLQSIVHAHHKGLGSDDFVKEKGQGLIVNLSGPPGVGSFLPWNVPSASA